MRVLLVCENLSARMGGEALSPVYYALKMKERRIDVWIICHARVRDDVRELFGDLDQVAFVDDTRVQKILYRLVKNLPTRFRDLIGYELIHVVTSWNMRPLVRRIIRRSAIDVVFEPTPIMPKGLSYMYKLGVPVVMGPLCGGMDLPPAYRGFDPWLTRVSVTVGRYLADLANRWIPGKRDADALIVANPRTVRALPCGCLGRIYTVPDGGVDLRIWSTDGAAVNGRGGPVRFVYSGRFVDWKGVGLLVEAFKDCAAEYADCALDLIGDGELRAEMEDQVKTHALGDRVRFHGWLSRPEIVKVVAEADVFVMPSLRECGSSSILEAMALSKPVIATNWGGNAELVDPSCGLLVEPAAPRLLIAGLAEAMLFLARSPETRARMGRDGKARIGRHFYDWDSKVDRVVEILREVIAAAPHTPAARSTPERAGAS